VGLLPTAHCPLPTAHSCQFGTPRLGGQSRRLGMVESAAADWFAGLRAVKIEMDPHVLNELQWG